MKYIRTDNLSKQTLQNLFALLDSKKIAYKVIEDDVIAANTSRRTTSLLEEAENMSRGEHGYLVKVRKSVTETVWVPADTHREAFEKAIEMAKTNEEMFSSKENEYSAANALLLMWPEYFYNEDELDCVKD